MNERSLVGGAFFSEERHVHVWKYLSKDCAACGTCHFSKKSVQHIKDNPIQKRKVQHLPFLVKVSKS
jgi:hypothetical protein